MSAITMNDWEGSVPLYIASESYGGRIAVEFAYALAHAVQGGTIRCNLRGLFLGSPWLSPVDSIAAWPQYLAGLGFVDEGGRERIERKVAAVRDTVRQSERPGLSMEGWHGLQQTIVQETGGINCYNVLKPSRKEIQPHDVESDEVLVYGETLWWYSDTGPPPPESHTSSNPLEQLMRGPVSHTLGIAATKRPPWGTQRTAVFDALGDDFLQSSVGTVQRLLNETDLELVVYSARPYRLPAGDTRLDGSIVRTLAGEPFTTEPSGIIEGYRSRYSDRFTHYTVLRAGHMVPADNPSAMLHILHRHVGGTPVE
ncbi:AGAP011443-PA [Anopheles gambiae str. PEST]|uniref:AGAP011443-PA n=1 Tax=Anopheles gambiae TaxID=7165 RepID=Q5TPZ5_ANOGA|nr:AGAP011443-PA [Anopheles gambiae str. PEST]